MQQEPHHEGGHSLLLGGMCSVMEHGKCIKYWQTMDYIHWWLFHHGLNKDCDWYYQVPVHGLVQEIG